MLTIDGMELIPATVALSDVEHSRMFTITVPLREMQSHIQSRAGMYVTYTNDSNGFAQASMNLATSRDLIQGWHWVTFPEYGVNTLAAGFIEIDQYPLVESWSMTPAMPVTLRIQIPHNQSAILGKVDEALDVHEIDLPVYPEDLEVQEAWSDLS